MEVVNHNPLLFGEERVQEEIYLLEQRKRLSPDSLNTETIYRLMLKIEQDRQCNHGPMEYYVRLYAEVKEVEANDFNLRNVTFSVSDEKRVVAKRLKDTFNLDGYWWNPKRRNRAIAPGHEVVSGYFAPLFDDFIEDSSPETLLQGKK